MKVVIILDLRQLETFIEVIKMKSFSKAAHKLYLTQPTVTSHIQNLEKEMGTILVNRSGKEISTTEAGDILYNYALNIINTCQMAQFHLGTYKGKIEGHLDISASTVPRQHVLPRILKDFIKKYPDVTFTIGEDDSKQVLKSILDGDTDFGIIGAKYNSKYLEYIELLEDNVIGIAPNIDKYDWKPYDKLDLSFLYNEKIILREKGSGTRYLFENEIRKKNIDLQSLNIICFVQDNETIKKFVEIGLGISFVSEAAVKHEIDQGLLKPFRLNNMKFTRNFYFVYHKKRQLSPLTQTFKDFVTKYALNNKL